MGAGNLGLYTATVLIWGSTWLAIEFQLGLVDPAVSLVWRFGCATLIMVVWSLFRGGFSAVRPGDLPWLAAQGVCLFGANYLLFYLAASLLPSGLLAVSFSTIVGMNILFGALFFGLPVKPRLVVGALIGLSGIGLIFLPEIRSLSLSDDAALGLVLCLVATALASFGNLVSGRTQKTGVPVIQGNALGMAFGTLVLTLFALATGKPFAFDPSAGYVLSLGYLIVFGSVIAFWCYLTLLGRIGADRAAYAMVLFPVVALCLSTLFEGYRWTPEAWAGLALVVLGNLLVLARRLPSVPGLGRLHLRSQAGTTGAQSASATITEAEQPCP